MEQYHPKRKRNEIIGEDEKKALIARGTYITIALCNDSVPYIITLSYGYDRERSCLYFHCANKGDKLDFIRLNQNACGTIIKDNGYLETKCDHDYESLVIRGKMHIVADLDEKKHGLQILLNHLEKDPKPIFERNIKSDKSYDSVTILRFDMESIIGKKHIE